MGEILEISLRERIRQNLVSAMGKANVNQVQLAERLGISKGTVNNWTRGNNSPDVDMVPQICNVLGISILDLYSSTEKESPSTDETAPGEEIYKLAEALNDMLVAQGVIQDGSDLTDRQSEVLIAVCRIIDATFKD